MKYLLIAICALITTSAHARLSCSASCTLIGPQIKETQNFVSFDGRIQGPTFWLEKFNGLEIRGGFNSNGYPGTFCGDMVTKVWINLDGERSSWEDSEIIFNINETPYKFFCDLNGKVL